MPSDANGVFSLVSGYLAVTGETIQASQHNPVLEDIASSMSSRLMRSGVAPMTGALKIVDGSVGAPAVQFSSNTSTGLYKTANGIGVSINGTKVAEFTPSGLGRMIGELIPWALLSAPSGWVLPYGQTLSRTTYADLWTIAQTEIAGGNTFFNNGDGSTTFGIGDLRGRVIAGKDNMGGTSAGRLAPPASGGVTDSSILGSSGGDKSHTLTTSQMASHYHNADIYDPGHDHATDARKSSGATATLAAGGILTCDTAADITPAVTNIQVTSPNGGGTTYSAGGGAAHNNVQPTIICNYILYAGA